MSIFIQELVKKLKNMNLQNADEKTLEAICLLSESGCLPTIKNEDLAPLMEKDVNPFINTIEKCLLILNKLVNQMLSVKQKIPDLVVVHMLLICGEHQFMKNHLKITSYLKISNDDYTNKMNEVVNTHLPWMTEETKRLTNDILKKITMIKNENIGKIITNHAGKCLEILNEKIGKDKDWLDNLARTNSFLWIISNINPKNIKQHMNINILVKIMEHHSTEYKLKSILCFLYYFECLTPREIATHFCNEKGIFLKNVNGDLILVLPIILCCCKMFDAYDEQIEALKTSSTTTTTPNDNKNQPQQIQHNNSSLHKVSFRNDSRDKLINIIIPLIEMGNTDAKGVFINALCIIINQKQFSSISWHYAITNIIEMCIPIIDVYKNLLFLFKIYLLSAWPLFPQVFDQLCYYLFKMYINCNYNYKIEIYSCFFIIRKEMNGREEFNNFLKRIIKELNNEKVNELIRHKFNFEMVSTKV